MERIVKKPRTLDASTADDGEQAIDASGLLTCVSVVLLHTRPPFAALNHMTQLIDSFLGFAPLLASKAQWTIVTASERGYLHLMNRLAAQEDPDDDWMDPFLSRRTIKRILFCKQHSLAGP